MKKALYYSFLGIFIATALITLLGILNVIHIDGFYLKALMGAFLVEMAAALIAVFRKTDFFSEKNNSSIGSTVTNMIGTFDRLSDEIEAAINNQPPPPVSQPRGFLILRFGNAIAAYQKMQEFDDDHFENLPEGTKRQILAYRKSMDKLEAEWEKIKTGSNSLTDPKGREKQLTLIRDMKNDLIGVTDMIETSGFWLHDHYHTVRAMIMQLK